MTAQQANHMTKRKIPAAINFQRIFASLSNLLVSAMLVLIRQILKIIGGKWGIFAMVVAEQLEIEHVAVILGVAAERPKIRSFASVSQEPTSR